jgi:hypothetical protein
LKTGRILYLFIIISIFCRGTVSAQFGSVFFEPDTTYVTIYDSTEIDIAIDANLEGIHCFIVSVGFDTLLVELTEVIEGSLLPGTGQTFFFWNQSQNGYDIGSCLLGFGLYANGPGTLATMKFRAREDPGISSLHFTSQEFTDTLLNPIYVIPLYGAIVVEDSVVAVEDTGCCDGLPEKFVLYQNYPNPFNSSTSVKYGLSQPDNVRIEIFDILGRLQDVIFSGEKSAGYHIVTWNADGFSSGIYYLKLTAGDLSETRKILLIK